MLPETEMVGRARREGWLIKSCFRSTTCPLSLDRPYSPSREVHDFCTQIPLAANKGVVANTLLTFENSPKVWPLL